MSSDIILLSFSLVFVSFTPHRRIFFVFPEVFIWNTDCKQNKCKPSDLSFSSSTTTPAKSMSCGSEARTLKISSFLLVLFMKLYPSLVKPQERKSTPLPTLLLKIENPSIFSRSTKQKNKSFFISLFQWGEPDEGILLAKGLWQVVQDWRF